MALSLYQVSVAAFQRQLAATEGCLDRAVAHADANGIAHTDLLEARFAPDMFDFTRQIQVMCDFAVRGSARLAGGDVPSFPDTETSFAELKARIGKVQAFLAGLEEAAVNAGEGRKIEFSVGEMKFSFENGTQYLTEFILPNLYFHATAAYALLRFKGVELGKRDFLGWA